jgi:hypothetical protein
MLRLNTSRHAVVFETWQKRAPHWAKRQLINQPKIRKKTDGDGLPMPLSLLVEPLELASDAVQNIPSKIKTKTLKQKKRIKGQVKMAGL